MGGFGQRLVQMLDRCGIGEDRLSFGTGEGDATLAKLLLGLKLRDDNGALRLSLSHKLDLLLQKGDLVALSFQRLEGGGPGFLAVQPRSASMTRVSVSLASPSASASATISGRSACSVCIARRACSDDSNPAATASFTRRWADACASRSAADFADWLACSAIWS